MTEVASIPFYGNTEDDLHCVQAVMRMMLGHFTPERDFSWAELDEMSNKHEGMGTWLQKLMISFDDLGLECVSIEGFDGPAFIRNGEQYLRDAFGDETADWQVGHSNIPEEQAIYQQAFDKGIQIEKRIPDFDELAQRLSEGWLVSCNLNSRLLNGNPGYVGHRVLILAIRNDEVEFHDPGIPPQPNRREPREHFVAAWSSPNPDAQNYLAVRLKESA